MCIIKKKLYSIYSDTTFAESGVSSNGKRKRSDGESSGSEDLAKPKRGRPRKKKRGRKPTSNKKDVENVDAEQCASDQDEQSW